MSRRCKGANGDRQAIGSESGLSYANVARCGSCTGTIALLETVQWNIRRSTSFDCLCGTCSASRTSQLKRYSQRRSAGRQRQRLASPLPAHGVRALTREYKRIQAQVCEPPEPDFTDIDAVLDKLRDAPVMGAAEPLALNPERAYKPCAVGAPAHREAEPVPRLVPLDDRVLPELGLRQLAPMAIDERARAELGGADGPVGPKAGERDGGLDDGEDKLGWKRRECRRTTCRRSGVGGAGRRWSPEAFREESVHLTNHLGPEC